MRKRTKGERIFALINFIVLTVLAFSTLYPFLYTLTISLSTAAQAEAGGLHIIPDLKNITLDAYKLVFKNVEIWGAYKYTLFRTIVGTFLALLVTCLYSYALSRPTLPLKKFFVILVMIPMFFTPGQIPTYLNIKSLGLINNIWVYVLPMLITTYNVIICRSFFQSLPESLNESAKLDGAGELRTFLSIVLPLSMPIVMTLALWIAVSHWNSWYDSMMYITDTRLIVVQQYIQRIVNEDNLGLITDNKAAGSGSVEVVGKTIQSASIVVSILPILAVYPFIQKYFVKGITLGAVKG